MRLLTAFIILFALSLQVQFDYDSNAKQIHSTTIHNRLQNFVIVQNNQMLYNTPIQYIQYSITKKRIKLKP